MKNYTKKELREILKETRLKLCRLGLLRLLKYDNVASAWEASTRPGWMAVLLKRVLWKLMTEQEQTAVLSALESVGISPYNSEIDLDKANALRGELPNFFN